jgi:hypothetical protein
MTPAPKVGKTRGRLRRDTRDAEDGLYDEEGEACECPVAAMPLGECSLSLCDDKESYDNQEVSFEDSADGSDANDRLDRLSEGLGGEDTPVHAPLLEQAPVERSPVLGFVPGAPREEIESMDDDDLNDEVLCLTVSEAAGKACTVPNTAPLAALVAPHVCVGPVAVCSQTPLNNSLIGPCARVVPTGARWQVESYNPYAPLAMLVEEGEGEVAEQRAVPNDADEPWLKAPPSDALEPEGEHVYLPTPRHGNARFIGDRPEWSKRRRRRLGPVHAHASFLQHLFRRAKLVRPGCWLRRGGLAGLFIWRPVNHYACNQGLNLASSAEFEAQAKRASEVLAWYRNYVELLRILQGGLTPTVVDGCCGGGGKAEGIRRAGGAVHGIDIRPQPDFVRRFGEKCFTLGDATNPLGLKAKVKATRAFGVGSSPPCKSESTARQRGAPQDPDIMDVTRDALVSTGLLYDIECVLGAGPGMAADSTMLRGAMFGLRVDRARLFETNFPVHIDEALKAGGDALRAKCCQGSRRRWRRFDRFGRPEELYCCRGNTFAVQGDKPWRCTACECAEAMGVDEGHMSYLMLAQSIPPAYGQLIFAQKCMAECHRRYAIPLITFDDLQARKHENLARMRAWLVGAGDADGRGAVQFVPASAASALAVGDERAADVETEVTVELHGEGSPGREASAQPTYAVEPGAGGDEVAPATEERVVEAEFREIYFTHAGGYAQQIEGGRHVTLLDDVGHNTRVRLEADALVGQHTLVHVGRDRLRAALPMLKALVQVGAGTRVTVISDDRVSLATLTGCGYRVLRRASKGEPSYATVDERAATRRGYTALEWGTPRLSDGGHVDYERAEGFMDPRDLSKDPDEAQAKALRSYVPIRFDTERWADVAMAQELGVMMKEGGHVIKPEIEPGFVEFPFYPFASEEGLMKSISEANRALLVGAMEYVPPWAVAEVRASAVIHPSSTR